MDSEKTVYRAADGSLAYDGLAWSELSDDERTARINECYALEFCSIARIAKILKAFTPMGRPNLKVIQIHNEKFSIVYPKLVHRPPTRMSSRRTVMSYSGSKLSGEAQQAKIRTQTACGKAVVAKAAEGPSSESYWDTLKKQKGFCVAVRSDGEYCGEDTGSPDVHFCTGHRSDRHGRSKPDFRGRIWMKLPASK